MADGDVDTDSDSDDDGGLRCEYGHDRDRYNGYGRPGHARRRLFATPGGVRGDAAASRVPSSPAPAAGTPSGSSVGAGTPSDSDGPPLPRQYRPGVRRRLFSEPVLAWLHDADGSASDLDDLESDDDDASEEVSEDAASLSEDYHDGVSVDSREQGHWNPNFGLAFAGASPNYYDSEVLYDTEDDS